MSRHSRRIPPGLRRQKYHEADGHCRRCGCAIDVETFHVAHVRSDAHGGPAIPENLEAWCAPCNIAFGNRDADDTRVQFRDWQKEALEPILKELTFEQVATLMAAPGAGKTLFTALIFAVGQDAGLWSRLLVLVPRVPLVNQWARALLHGYHIDLDTHKGARDSGRELQRMDGVATTYQSLLSPDVRERHRDALRDTRTLVVLDEVHHLGQPLADESGGPAWSQAVRELVGDVRTGLQVAGVLNLSGTLFRTSPRERIATVRYTDLTTAAGEARIQAIANYEIHPERLVREGLLRPPNLFRVGATVQIVDLTTAEVTTSPIADLSDDQSKRLALRQLNLRPEWIVRMVSATLDQLEMRHRDGVHAPVKALIVTHRQEMARAFGQEVDRQMVARGLQPLAEVVVSDDGLDAYRRLEDFRRKPRVGVLCTVGMAGEGYDCPELAVVTYATNVLTPQYIRQVVARGQRVTEWERQKLGRSLTAAIILPDIPDLVKEFTTLLAPMVHEIDPQIQSGGPGPTGPGGPGLPTKDLISVQDAALDVVSAVTATGAADVDPALADLLLPLLRELMMLESDWPRIAILLQKLDKQRPFDPSVFGGTAQARPDRPTATSRPLTSREHHEVIRTKLVHLTRWWAHFPAKNGGEPVSHFVTAVYRQAGIRSLNDATPEQLILAWQAARVRIDAYCREKGIMPPKIMREEPDAAHDAQSS